MELRNIYFFLIVFESLYHATSQAPVYEVDPDSIGPLFKLLESHGKNKLDERNKNAKHPILQFVVITVVSEKELGESVDWDEIPEEIQQQRLDFEINERKKPNRHGEILILFSDIIPGMIDVLKSNEGEDVFPRVVLFSYYIPCAGIEDQGYNCAEELGNVVRANRDNYLMLVGFKDIFKGTDKEKSTKFMMDGMIQAFSFHSPSGTFVSLYDLPDEYPTSNIEPTFQSLMFKCLSDTSLIECHTHVEGDDPEPHIAHYVNMITFECTSQSKSVGKLTNFNKQLLFQCISDYVEKQDITCARLKNRTKKDKQLSIMFCVLNSVAYANSVGEPSSPYNTYTKVWKPNIGAWNAIYRTDYVTLDRRQPVFCLNLNNTKRIAASLEQIRRTEGGKIRRIANEQIRDLNIVRNSKQHKQ